MDRGVITISETGAVIIPTAPVWMTQFEIADLFGVLSCHIRKAIHAIYKNKELNECDTMKYVKQPDGISYDAYNLEMIIAIAFIVFALNHPEMSFPWNNTITWLLYGVYFLVTVVLLIAPKIKK